MSVDGHADAERRQIGACLGNCGEGEAGEGQGSGEEAAVEGESSGGETAVRSGTREGAEEEGVRCGVGGGEEVGIGGGASRDCEGGQLCGEGQGAPVAGDDEARVGLL